MAITNFIPTVWSKALYDELAKNYVGVKLSNREFEGEIKTQGDRVKINGLGPVTVFTPSYIECSYCAGGKLISRNFRTVCV